MAKDKDKSVNPAQQQRKLEKAKALKKSRAELQSRRNEKLARRNPDRIQRQIDDLKALEASGDIKPREKAILQELERDIKSVHKAREALGEQAPRLRSTQGNSRTGGNNILGKRKHDGERNHNNSRHYSSGSDTDDSIRRIPMPEDTPPPIPRGYRRNFTNNNKNPNFEPLNNNNSRQIANIPATEARTTYESAPQIRDLKKEAISKFVPNVVRRKQEAVKGTGSQLVEPEELDRLEAQGYLKSDLEQGNKNQDMDAEAEAEAETKRLAEEEARFQKEIEMEDADSIAEGAGSSDRISPSRIPDEQRVNRKHQVQMEEVEDQDG